MNWGDAQTFFAMGGYGLYVWGSYGVAALCIVIELWALRRRARTLTGAASPSAGERSSTHLSG